MQAQRRQWIFCPPDSRTARYCRDVNGYNNQPCGEHRSPPKPHNMSEQCVDERRGTCSRQQHQSTHHDDRYQEWNEPPFLAAAYKMPEFEIESAAAGFTGGTREIIAGLFSHGVLLERLTQIRGSISWLPGVRPVTSHRWLADMQWVALELAKEPSHGCENTEEKKAKQQTRQHPSDGKRHRHSD